MIDKLVITGCINGDHVSQKKLYEFYSPRLLAILYRYTSDRQIAEDILIEGYVKVFNNLTKFRDEGSFDGWIKRIFINEALMYLRKSKKLQFEAIEELPILSDYQPDVHEISQLLKLVDQLPQGCRTVFNLFVFEDMKHKEIAEMLDITVSTSKSQYQLARTKLIALMKSNNEFSQIQKGS